LVILTHKIYTLSALTTFRKKYEETKTKDIYILGRRDYKLASSLSCWYL